MWVIVAQCQMSNMSAISYQVQWNDDVCFVLDQHTLLNLYSASSLKQPSVDKHVAPFGHIILIPSQPVFALCPYCCVLTGEARNINFIGFFFFTWPGLEPTIYGPWWGKNDNHYTRHGIKENLTPWKIN